MATHSSVLAWRIPKDRETWWATVHGVAKSRIRLSDWPLSLYQGSWNVLGNEKHEVVTNTCETNSF